MFSSTDVLSIHCIPYLLPFCYRTHSRGSNMGINDEHIENYYPYDPSTVLAGIGLGVFLIPSILHGFLLIKHRAWFCLPFALGGFCKYSTSVSEQTASVYPA